MAPLASVNGEDLDILSAIRLSIFDGGSFLNDAVNLVLLRQYAAERGIVNTDAVLAALTAKRLKYYICDFPSEKLQGHPQVIALPHLGASTREAEDNCAVMVVDQVREYLENGTIENAVNFPDVTMARESPYRLGIANANVPNMVGQISTAMAHAGLNIHTMINKSRGEMAYTLVDVDSAVPVPLVRQLESIEGVLSVHYLPADQK